MHTRVVIVMFSSFRTFTKTTQKPLKFDTGYPEIRFYRDFIIGYGLTNLELNLYLEKTLKFDIINR